jgi:histidinol-phosphate/aromatic aminotransferase/cobyric acid decarboxylase-like protein
MIATHGGEPRARMDFSTCVNAYGPAPVVIDAIRRAEVAAYPDPRSVGVRWMASRVWGRAIEEIAFGAGSAELIAAVVAAVVRRGETVVVPRPAFAEYGRAAVLAGARVRRPARVALEASGDEIADAMIAAVCAHRPRLAFLAAPTSPVGTAIGREALRAVADACAMVGGMLVLDQAYDAFLAEPLGTPALPGHPAVVHLRSLTKDHALAGVRVGFAIGPAAVIAAIEGVRVPWAASSVAQAAGAAALSDSARAYVLETTRTLRASAAALFSGSRTNATLATATHYGLIRVGDGRRVRDALLGEDGIGVRDCRSFGLPAYIRVAARTAGENAALAAALRRVCG